MPGIGLGISPMFRRGGRAASSTLLTGLSGSWSFNSTPNDNLGANNGVATNTTYASGKFSNAAIFDGTGFISVTDSSIFTFGSADFAYSIWTKRNLSGTREVFTGQSDSSGADASISFWLEFTSSNYVRVVYVLSGFGTQVMFSNTTIADTNWHNIILQRNGINLELYIDGTLDSFLTTLSITHLNNSSYPFGIGNAGDLSVLKFNGLIDEVNLWTGRKLTSTEIGLLQTKAYPF